MVIVGVSGPEVLANVIACRHHVPFTSFRVTVICWVVEPSAVIEAVVGLTVEVPAFTAPAVNVTVEVAVIGRLLSVTSVAVKTSTPAVVDSP